MLFLLAWQPLVDGLGLILGLPYMTSALTEGGGGQIIPQIRGLMVYKYCGQRRGGVKKIPKLCGRHKWKPSAGPQIIPSEAIIHRDQPPPPPPCRSNVVRPTDRPTVLSLVFKVFGVRPSLVEARMDGRTDVRVRSSAGPQLLRSSHLSCIS